MGRQEGYNLFFEEWIRRLIEEAARGWVRLKYANSNLMTLSRVEIIKSNQCSKIGTDGNVEKFRLR